MPEGPEIKRSADKIAAAIAHRPIKEIFFAFDHLKPYAEKLESRQIIAIEPRGKALLTRFDNGLNIYSHNQLYGKWVICNAYSYPETNWKLRLAIHTERKSALLYSASDIDVLADGDLDHHPFLQRIGPDVLDERVTVEQVMERLCDREFYRRKFTTLLLDQHFLAGLGNYLRTEILFVARVHPERRPVDCTEAELKQVAEAAIAVPRQSYVTAGITNDVELANQLKAQGYKRAAYRHWVFNRQHQPCFVCGTPIVKAMSGGRRYYFCPTCQGTA